MGDLTKRRKKMKNLNIIFLAFLISISMYNCMEVGLGAASADSEAEAEGRIIWPWTNCQTQTETSEDCCLYYRCRAQCNFIQISYQQTSCMKGCSNLCPGSGGCLFQC